MLQVSGRTVRDRIDKGVVETKSIVDELRHLGQDRDLVGAGLNQLELEALGGDDRFLKAPEQMKRVERGQWPADFDA